MLLGDSLDPQLLVAIATSCGVIISGAIGYLIKMVFDYKKKRRENKVEEDKAKIKLEDEEDAARLKRENASAQASLERRRNDIEMVNAPLKLYIAKLEEQIEAQKKDIQTASQQNLTKIFDSIIKESEAQKKVAQLEERCKYLTERLNELQQQLASKGHP